MESNKIKLFDGKDDVKVFLTRAGLIAAVKELDGERKAQFLASKLLPPALDVYMRMSADDQKDFSKIEEALLKEFHKGQLNREEAIHLLSERTQKTDETPQTFAYKVLELVKLSYPDFTEVVRLTIAKDYYLKGVHPDMQVALKSWSEFADKDIHELAIETVRLELAGVKSFSKSSHSASSSICNVTCDGPEENLVNAVADKIMDRLKLSDSAVAAGDGRPDGLVNNRVNYADGRSSYYADGRQFNNSRGNRGRARNRGTGGTHRRGYSSAPRPPSNRGGRSCRACKATDHFVRDCPMRFCQACGKQGHDQSSDQCPNYEA